MDTKRDEYKDDLAEAEENLRTALLALKRARHINAVTAVMCGKATAIARVSWEINDMISELGSPSEPPTPHSSPCFFK